MSDETQNVSDEKKNVPSISATVIKKPVDLQRMKLEKLMKNLEKPAFIPDIHKDKKFPDAPEFVRNVMGSSAGAGSGEFHVYRHIRRREYSRNLYLQMAKEKNMLDEEFHGKREQNKREAEEKTAKKRTKRQRYKQKQKMKKLLKTEKNESSESEKSESEESEVESESIDKNNGNGNSGNNRITTTGKGNCKDDGILANKD